MKARIHVIAGPGAGRVVDLEPPQVVTLGRATDVELSIPADTALSRRHVQFELGAITMRMRDLGSKHGVHVNGVRVPERELAHGDRVQAGDTVMRVEIVGAVTIAPTLQPTLAPTLAPTNSPDVVTVRCRCGVTALDEPAHRRDEGVVYLCPNCQEELAITPILPAGFEMVRMLGRGAMGCVYAARHGATGELRAIKQILPKAAMTAQARTLFTREASVQAQLDHPNIVRVYELVEPAPGSFCIVMELVDGASAASLITDGKTIEPALAVSIGCQALDGLAHAHSRQIVHRDVKEDNLMLAKDAAGAVVVKVADFGLAKNFQDSGGSGITRDGALGGTLPYMPKEQLLDYRYVKPPADIYALGATLYRLLTGQFARDFKDGDNWIRIALEQPIVPLRQRPRGSALPPALCAVIEKALEPDLARRYHTAADMRRALAAC